MTVKNIVFSFEWRTSPDIAAGKAPLFTIVQIPYLEK
jgi:hypothetical protein